MYGLIIEAIIEAIKLKYGNQVWEDVKKKARIDQQFYNTHQQYSEAVLTKIVRTLATLTSQGINELMEMFGVEFINFMTQFGYDRIMRVLGRHMRDFLNGLDNLHEYMRFSYPKLKAPSFFVEKETPNGLTLHYRSKRRGFNHYVSGQIKQIGRIFYKLEVKIDIIGERVETDMIHVVYQLHFENKQYSKMQSSTSSTITTMSTKAKELCTKPIKSGIFFELFPFHLIINRELQVTSLGESLKQGIKNAEGESIKDVFNLTRPLIPFTWDDIISHTNNVFELVSIEPVVREDGGTYVPITTNEKDDKMESLMSTSDVEGGLGGKDDSLKLRGQMIFVKELDSLVFLATPVIENLESLFHTGFYINDLSMHDASRDLVLVGTQHSSDLKLALNQEKQKSKALEDSMKQLDHEIKRADELLYRMIPKRVADRLRNGEPVMNLCEIYSSVTVLFSDVVGFTSTCTQLSPMEVVSFLNEMYSKFDKALESHNVYKVETIGDAYMIVSGAPERTTDHAIEILDMAFDMLAQIHTLKNPTTGKPMMIRIGCHTGSVVSGVVGLRMPRYCLFGDTVNSANRMEATSEPMRIHITQSTKQFLPENRYKIEERGILDLGGKGRLKTFLVTGKLDKTGNLINLPFMNVTPSNSEKKETKINAKWEGFTLIDAKK